MEKGPWIWGRAGLLLTIWLIQPSFHVYLLIPVWVKVPTLPILLREEVIERIGKTLGKFIGFDRSKKDDGLYYARKCVLVELSKGQPNEIILKYNGVQWSQTLDHENTTYQCRLY